MQNATSLLILTEIKNLLLVQFKANSCKMTTCEGRDLARTLLARLLDRQFPEDILFGQTELSKKKFNSFPDQTIF